VYEFLLGGGSVCYPPAHDGRRAMRQRTSTDMRARTVLYVADAQSVTSA
jgi:hypothetical protein